MPDQGNDDQNGGSKPAADNNNGNITTVANNNGNVTMATGASNNGIVVMAAVNPNIQGTDKFPYDANGDPYVFFSIPYRAAELIQLRNETLQVLGNIAQGGVTNAYVQEMQDHLQNSSKLLGQAITFTEKVEVARRDANIRYCQRTSLKRQHRTIEENKARIRRARAEEKKDGDWLPSP